MTQSNGFEPQSDAVPRHVDILIVGSGFSGLCLAVRLRQARQDSFLIIEKEADIGGTWRDNRYPGCACDIPSHLYSLSFAPRNDWRGPEPFVKCDNTKTSDALHPRR